MAGACVEEAVGGAVDGICCFFFFLERGRMVGWMDRGDREKKEEEGGKWCEYDY